MMVMVAEYISALEADKMKLKAQVKRLCGENSWLRQSLQDTQQLLQECQVKVEKVLVEKEHLSFVLSQKTSSNLEGVALQENADEEHKTGEGTSRGGNIVCV